MTLDPERFKEFVLTEADIAATEQQLDEYLRLPKRTRLKYARNLRAALQDHSVVESEPTISISTPIRKPQPQADAQAMVGVFGVGFVVAVGGMALFLFALWVLTGGPFR